MKHAVNFLNSINQSINQQDKTELISFLILTENNIEKKCTSMTKPVYLGEYLIVLTNIVPVRQFGVPLLPRPPVDCQSTGLKGRQHCLFYTYYQCSVPIRRPSGSRSTGILGFRIQIQVLHRYLLSCPIIIVRIKESITKF